MQLARPSSQHDAASAVPPFFFEAGFAGHLPPVGEQDQPSPGFGMRKMHQTRIASHQHKADRINISAQWPMWHNAEYRGLAWIH